MIRATAVALGSLYIWDFVVLHGRYTDLAFKLLNAIERAFV
jgi:hypothetical protein